MKIPERLLIKHNVAHGDIFDTDYSVYRSFLIATDYICNKIVEGISTWDDYPEEKLYRQIAREEITKIGG